MEDLSQTGIGIVTPVAVARAWHRRIHVVLSRTVHRTILGVISHDCLNTAQSAAYAAILSLFPALIVAAAVVALLPDTAPLRFQLAAFFDRVLPPNVSPILDAYFQSRPSNIHSARAFLSAGFFSLVGAHNVIVTLMEGMRRAQLRPGPDWGFWRRRSRALLLVFLSLVPLAFASLLVAFGHAINQVLAPSFGPSFRTTFYSVAFVVRWAVTLGASAGLVALLYRLGVPPEAPGIGPDGSDSPSELRIWLKTLPGAIVATAMWFLTTLAFGWYVTRFANYSEIYGSLGAGIALLFWLYITSLSVLCGAEFNAHFHPLLLAEGSFKTAVIPLSAAAVSEDSPAHTDPRG